MTVVLLGINLVKVKKAKKTELNSKIIFLSLFNLLILIIFNYKVITNLVTFFKKTMEIQVFVTGTEIV